MLSGIGIEVGYKLTDDGDSIAYLLDPGNILQQRILMELDLNWFNIADGKPIKYDKDYGDAHVSVKPQKADKKKQPYQLTTVTLEAVAENKESY